MNLKITLVITVLNEASTIELLLNALMKQTHLPNEIIIVDGGSSDNTPQIINQFLKQKKFISNNFSLKILNKSNRAQARNWAISKAKHELIAITDAGCIPQPSWLEKLLEAYQKNKTPIIGGFFYGLPATPFEQAVVAYTLQMPQRVNPKSFIPTTRSVLLTKEIWKKLGKFDEKLTTNEDFPFFFHARQQQIPIDFTKEALVGWIPRKTMSEFIKMIFNFAKGDVEAGIIRPKVQLLFGRYLLVITAFFWLFLIKNIAIEKIASVLGLWLVIYLVWAIWKNLRYTPQGWYWLPIMQLTADLAVITGSVAGLVKRYKYQSAV